MPAYDLVILVNYFRLFLRLFTQFCWFIHCWIPLSSFFHILLLVFKPQWKNAGIISLDFSWQNYLERTTIKSGLNSYAIHLKSKYFNIRPSPTKKITNKWQLLLITSSLKVMPNAKVKKSRQTKLLSELKTTLNVTAILFTFVSIIFNWTSKQPKQTWSVTTFRNCWKEGKSWK